MKKKLLILATVFAMAAASSASAQIVKGTTSDSYTALRNGGGASPSTISFSFAHNSLGPALVVGCAVNDYPKQRFASISVNGVPLTKEWELQLSPYAVTAEWLGVSLPTGLVTIAVTMTNVATNGHGPACFATDFLGVDQLNPVAGIDTDNVPTSSKSNSVTCSFTAKEDGDVAVMYFYTTSYGGVPGPAITASPAPTDSQTGPWAAPQAAIAISPALFSGDTFSETWGISGGNLRASISVGAIILRKA